ncbi:MAG: hypothetical protein K0S56_1852 [Microvirga sp.]|jgi:hypothetical protein|nr:hypothetical protein [Microvirga sp.]
MLYRVPSQDQTIDLAPITALPRSGFIVDEIRQTV